MTDVDDGRAYGREYGTWDADLVETGAGTRSGELLRRYWHPVARSEEATTRPSEVRLLGEDLILYRDASGTPGLLEPRCIVAASQHRLILLDYSATGCVGAALSWRPLLPLLLLLFQLLP